MKIQVFRFLFLALVIVTWGCSDDSAGANIVPDAGQSDRGMNEVVTGTIYGTATLQGTMSDLGHGGIRIEVLGTDFATLTTSEGRFRMELPVGEHTLLTTYPGYAAVERDIALEEGALLEVRDVVLGEQPGSIRGSVLLPNGFQGPMVLDSVLVKLRRPDQGFDAEASQVTGLDAEGGYTLTEVSPGDWVVTIEAAGFRDIWLETKVHPGDRSIINPVQLQLDDEQDPSLRTVIVGQVILEGGATGGVWIESVGTPFATISTSDGRFYLQVSPGEHDLRFTYPGYDGMDYEVESIDPGTTHDIGQVTLLRIPGSIRGNVILPPGFAGAANFDLVTVEMRSPDDPNGPAAREVDVDEQGRYTIADVASGDWGLMATAPGFLPVYREVLVEPGVQADAPDLFLQLEEQEDPLNATAIEGTALLPGVGAGGHGGIHVEATGTPFATTTTSEGRFRLAVIPGEHTLLFSFPGYGVVTLGGVIVEQGELVQLAGNVTLNAPQASLTGRIQSPISVRSWVGITNVRLMGERGEYVGVVANDGDDATFSFDELPTGLFVLEVEVLGHHLLGQPVTIEEGENALPTVQVVPQRHRVQGRVNLRDRDDHGGVVVRARLNQLLVDTAVTDADGSFELGLTAQPHSITYTTAGFIDAQRIITWDANAEHFTIDAGAVFSQQVIVLQPQPLGDLDADGRIDLADNCTSFFNPDQEDIDGDGEGDACDNDMDGDGTVNAMDNCPSVFNPIQEDPDGNGTGLMCDGGTIDNPMFLGCGVANQILDTRSREDGIRASCGGGGSGEVVYDMIIEAGQSVDVVIDAQQATVIYILDSLGFEVACVLGREILIGPGANVDVALDPGAYQLVIDGLDGAEEAGAMAINISTDSCAARAVGDPILPDMFFAGAIEDVQVADLDSDGDTEVVVLAGNNIILADPAAQTQVILNTDGAVPAGASRLFIADLNGDGRQDIGTDSGAGGMRLLGQDDGRFVDSPWDVPEGTVLVRNFNRVGGPGFLRLPGNGANGFFALSDPVGNGGNPELLTDILIPNVLGGGSVQHVALGDFNADGNEDIGFCTTANNGNGGTGFFSADANGAFDAGRIEQLDGRFCTERGLVSADLDRDGLVELHHAQVASDMDGDGFVDLVSVEDIDRGGNPGRVVISFGDGLGGLTPMTAMAVVGSNAELRVGDVNRDGQPDLLTWQPGAALNNRLRFNGQSVGLLEPGRVIPGASEAAPETFFADVNTDGRLDVISQINPVTVRLGLVDGAFGEPEFYQLGNAISVRDFGDIDGDGVADLLVYDTEQRTGGFVSGFPNSLVVTPLSDFDPPEGEGGEGDAGLPNRGNGQAHFANGRLGDANGDGILDVVSYVSGAAWIRLGQADGGLGPVIHDHCVECGCMEAPNFEFIDLNGDGALDIVPVGGLTRIVFWDAENEQFVRGGGGKQVKQGTTFADFNEDGIIDVFGDIFENQWGCQPGIAGLGFGNADREQLPPLQPQLEPDWRTYPVFVNGDFDGDGHQDVAALEPGLDQVQVARGVGNCRFWDRTVLEAPVGSRRLVVDDVNGDGRDDLLVIGETMKLFTAPLIEQGASQLVVRNEPMCEGQAIDASRLFGSEATWDIDRDELCRIGRLDVEYTAADGATLRGPRFELSTHSDKHVLLTEDGLDPNGVMTPENTRVLSRLQGYPLFDGRWSLDAPVELSGARLLINAPPADPFDEENRYPDCEAGVDQSAAGDCILSESVDASFAQNGEVDTFIIEGPIRGGFLSGRQITVELQGLNNAPVVAEISVHPLGASLFETALIGSAGNNPGFHSTVVPAEFDSRYYVVELTGQVGSDYQLSFTEGPIVDE